MLYTIKIFERLGIKICYIKEINNYILLNKNITMDSGIYTVDEIQLKELIREHSEKEYDKFCRILSNRKELVNETETIEEVRYSQYTLTIHPSRTCNLACKYCFGNLDYLPKQGPSLEIAKQAIDFLVYKYAPFAKKYIIDLSGSGEPLLQFEFIKNIEEYLEILRNKTGKEILAMFVSNLTLMTEEMAEYFNKHPYILMGVSLDGNKELNKNRMKRNGQDAFEDIMKGIKLISPKNIGIAATITCNNEEVDEIYDFLYSVKNCDCISLQQVRDYTDKEISFYNLNQDNVMKHYEKLLFNIIKHLNQGDYDYLFRMLKGSDTLGNYIIAASYKGILSQYRCDGAKNRISVDNEGKLYSCSVMNGNENFYIGDIYNGVKEENRRKFLLPVDKYSEKCKNCWAAYICSGECFATAYYTNDNIYIPNNELCKYRCSLIEYAIAFVKYLEINYKEHYDKFLEFIQYTLSFSETDLGHWSTFMYLKSHGVSVTYSDMVNDLSKGIHGVTPVDLIEYVNKYIDNFDAYEIEDETVFNNINVPAIALINKQKTSKYEYCLINNITDAGVDFSMGDSTSYLISKKEFIQQYSSIIMTN